MRDEGLPSYREFHAQHQDDAAPGWTCGFGVKHSPAGCGRGTETCPRLPRAAPQNSPLVHFKLNPRALVPGLAHHLLLGNTRGRVGHHHAAATANGLGEERTLLPQGTRTARPQLRLTSIRLTASSIASEVEAISFSTMSPSSSCLMSKLLGLSSCRRRQQPPGLGRGRDGSICKK